MIIRTAEQTVLMLLEGFPTVTITGPRQSGKTTLAKTVFRNRPYVSLEDPDSRQAALDDPRSFLDRFPNGAVLDEVQRCPDLLSYLQGRIDADGRMGLFILTGSQHFGLLSGISQSLAGRTAFVELLPFTLAELQQAAVLPQTVDELLFKGGYPPLYQRKVAPRAWFSSYVASYVERDVRQLLKVQELSLFQRFVRLCAGRTGQLLNLSGLAAECGVTHNTAKAWIAVLEASYILFLLQPHHANFNKRLVKTPKLYFYDTGLACWLLGLQHHQQVSTHPLRGALFETLVISELAKQRLNAGERPELYFWRDSNGNEIDVIMDTGSHLLPIEIKSGVTVAGDFFSGLRKWRQLAGEQAGRQLLVYGGEESYRQNDIEVVGWKELASRI
jgi:predicted AAA+ superfamily ATPase